MKSVLQIGTFDIVGGAARAARRLHDGLRQIGWDSQIVAGKKTTNMAHVSSLIGVAQPYMPRGLAAMEQQSMRLAPLVGDIRLPFRSSRAFSKSLVFQQARVINLHNLHGNFFDYTVLPTWAMGKHVVWTLHDMWPLTGHCAYSYQCERWKTGCYDCPLYTHELRPLDDIPQTMIDRCKPVWHAKHAVYRRLPMTVVAPSRWLYELACMSMLAANPHTTFHHVPYGIDTNVYRQHDRHFARAALGIPQDKQVVLFTADSLYHERKGFAYLLAALEQLKTRFPDLFLLTLGMAQGLPFGPEQVRSLDKCDDEYLQSVVYSAADVVAVPSLADNQPLVILEAMACGVPVVAFRVGGIPEMVRHGVTGYTAEPQSSRDLANGIRQLLEDEPLRQHLGEQCRATILHDYPLHLQAHRYTELYQALPLGREDYREIKVGIQTSNG